MMLLFLTLFHSSWAVEVLNLQRQLVLEAEAAHAANVERLQVSPQDCQISLRQHDRIRVLRANVVHLSNMGGLTHCPALTDSDPQSTSHLKWQEARTLSGETRSRLDPRTMVAQLGKPDPLQGIVRPQAPAPAAIPQVSKPQAPPRAAPGAASSGGGKPCEILVLSGELQGSANKVPTRESCAELCESFKSRAQSVRCYFGDERL